MPIKFDSLTSSKFPLQMLHLNHPFLIKSDHQPRIVFTTLVQLDRNQPRFPSQIDPGGIELVLSNNMLSSEHQRLRISAIFGPQSSGFSISFSLQVPLLSLPNFCIQHPPPLFRFTQRPATCRPFAAVRHRTTQEMLRVGLMEGQENKPGF
uniref:Uncharacterized protein n=1 Tax=Opuntia streptacantha TaxID=393608 RepID=A0A7C9CJU7_OPUST